MRTSQQPPIAGKTKQIISLPDLPGFGRVFSYDAMTSGNGAHREEFAGKGVLANAITCDVFERLAYHGVPLAFDRREGDQFITRLADMIPIEIVVRNRATGSVLKRHPSLIEGYTLNEPLVEFFYKTTGCKIDGNVVEGLEDDDPLALLQENGELWLYPADRPPEGEPVHIIEPPQNENDYFPFLLDALANIALQVNFYLKTAWQQQGGEVWDFKIECGEVDGVIVVADVIDFDSWRVFVDGKPVSKQLFRDRAPHEAVRAALELTARMTAGFAI